MKVFSVKLTCILPTKNLFILNFKRPPKATLLNDTKDLDILIEGRRLSWFEIKIR